MKESKYDVIIKDNIEDLILAVNSRIKQQSGWYPLGGVSISTINDPTMEDVYTFFCQTMVQEWE